MRLVVGVGVIMGGAMLASAHGTVSYVQARTGKQFGFNQRHQQQQNYGNNLQKQLQQLQQQQGYSNNNNNNNQQRQGYNTDDYNTLLQQYAALASASSSANANSVYYDSYGDTGSDYAQDYLPAAAYSTSSVAESSDSSPALSALALLGFLYFLNLIQDVLQNNGRKKRSVDPFESANETYYSTTYLDDPHITSPEVDPKEVDLKLLKEEEVKAAVLGKKDENTSPYLEVEAEPLEPDSEEEDLEKNGDAEGDLERSSEVDPEESEYSPRSFSFLEDFFIKLPRALGLTRRRRPIDRDGRDEKPMTVGNYITSRIKMISSIMSFLQNPSPLRIRRDTQDESSSETLDLILGTLGALFSENEEDLQSGERKTEEDIQKDGLLSRVRRFTHSMNAWYDDLGGRNYEPSTTSAKVAAKVTSLLGGGNNLQQAVKKDAVPTFLELSKSLDGQHPHCLQRALCRINSHTHGVSFVPRLAIQFLSSQLATSSSYSDGLTKANQRAMAVGREGLDCEKEFPDCPT